jgi:hypothetical protein
MRIWKRFKCREVVSKRQIAFESKAQADEKAQHTCEYVSILKRSATQLSDARWGFDTTSIHTNFNRKQQDVFRPISAGSGCSRWMDNNLDMGWGCLV